MSCSHLRLPVAATAGKGLITACAIVWATVIFLSLASSFVELKENDRYSQSAVTWLGWSLEICPTFTWYLELKALGTK